MILLRYGYTPLPRVIRKDVFDDSVSRCSESDAVLLARHWYRLDTNAAPPEYVLRPLSSLADAAYWAALPKLLALFNDATFDPELGDIKCHHSVTEWEVKSAVSKEPNMDRVAWFRRVFDGGVTEADSKVFKDFNDVAGDGLRSKNFKELIDWMTSNIPSNRIFSHCDVSYASFASKDAAWMHQLMSFSRDLYGLLRESLQTIIDARQEWGLNAGGLGGKCVCLLNDQ